MGWAIYSAERFMVTPAVTGVVGTAAGDGAGGGTLAVEAYMAYRR